MSKCKHQRYWTYFLSALNRELLWCRDCGAVREWIEGVPRRWVLPKRRYPSSSGLQR